ncbi:MAG: DUF2314 domain-containing protein [Pseudomonadota bacterium]
MRFGNGASGIRRLVAAGAACAALMAAPASAQSEAETAQRPPIAAYQLDDAEMNAAIDKARRTLPRFVSIHQSRNEAPEDLEFLALVAAESAPGEFEYRWLTDVKLAPDAITGVFSEDGAPFAKGESYRAEPDMIADWMIKTESGAVIGGYTLRVLVSRSDAETQALHEGRFLD